MLSYGRGVSKVILDFDSLQVVHFIKSTDILPTYVFGEVIIDIRHVLNNNKGYHIGYVIEEANQGADYLMKIGIRIHSPLNIRDIPPTEISCLCLLITRLPRFVDLFNLVGFVFLFILLFSFSTIYIYMCMYIYIRIYTNIYIYTHIQVFNYY